MESAIISFQADISFNPASDLPDMLECIEELADLVPDWRVGEKEELLARIEELIMRNITLGD